MRPAIMVNRVAANASTDAPLTVTSCFSLEINEPRQVLTTVGRCIYCGAAEYEPGTGKPLSDEHFVPEGLGSRLLLAEASCRDCAALTMAFENAMLQKLMLAARRKLKIRGKKRKRDKAKFAVRRVDATGIETIEWHTLEDHPTVLLLVAMDAPGLIQGRKAGEPALMLPWAYTPATIKLKDRRSFSTPALDTVALCQMLAKIAHGFAVWQFGLDGFTPMLLELILHGHNGDQSLSRYFVVGGSLRELAPTNALHVLGWDIHLIERQEYLVVAVRLFSYLGAPIYFVVVGRLNIEQAGRARLIAEAHAQASEAAHRPAA